MMTSSSSHSLNKSRRRRHHQQQQEQQIRNPSELYPIVTDLTDLDSDPAALAACGCGETFGSFKLSDLVLPVAVHGSPSLWSTLCPCDVSSSNNNNYIYGDERKGDRISQGPNNNLKSSRDTNHHQQHLQHTPIKKSNRGHEKKDSVATVATAVDIPEDGLMTPARTMTPRAEDHPLRDFNPPTSTTVPQSSSFAPPSTTSRRSRHRRIQSESTPPPLRSVLSASVTRKLSDSRLHVGDHDDGDFKDHTRRDRNDGNKSDLDDSAHVPTTPSGRKKMHLRKKSRQLMNMLLVRSNSMTSSSRDLSTTETATESHSGNNEDRTFADTYILTRKVLQCRQSQVWECLHRDSGILYCTKILECSQEQAYAEIDMFYNLSKQYHPSIVRLVEVMAEQTRAYVVMEWAAGGNLLTKIVQEGPVDEEMAKDITRCILEGCLLMHSNNLVHSDLQPENILLTNDTNNQRSPAVVADFGSAVNLNVHDPYGSRFGNILYTAPEVLQGAEPFGTQADMWSVGCLVYFMLSGGLSPFEERPSSKRKTTTKIMRAEYAFANCSNASRSVKQFMSQLLHADPSVRMTAEEALEHPWLRSPTPQAALFNRRGSGLGHQCHQNNHHDTVNRCGNDPSLVDSSMMSVSSKRVASPNPRDSSPLPADCSHLRKNRSKKHHRKLSSLTIKGISKLFSPKDPSTTEPSAHQSTPSMHQSVDFSSSMFSSDLGPPPPPSPCNRTVNSWGGSRSDKKTDKHHHRRQVTS